MKAAESFEKTYVEETFDENLSIEFMKKVAIWDYFGISKNDYLTLSVQERDKISKYYSDMKSRKSGGKHIFVIFLSFFIL